MLRYVAVSCCCDASLSEPLVNRIESWKVVGGCWCIHSVRVFWLCNVVVVCCVSDCFVYLLSTASLSLAFYRSWRWWDWTMACTGRLGLSTAWSSCQYQPLCWLSLPRWGFGIAEPYNAVDAESKFLLRQPSLKVKLEPCWALSCVKKMPTNSPVSRTLTTMICTPLVICAPAHMNTLVDIYICSRPPTTV